jgi:hypothetical protein
VPPSDAEGHASGTTNSELVDFGLSPRAIGAVFGVAAQSERAGCGRNGRVSPLR